jgi:hypothetical protein
MSNELLDLYDLNRDDTRLASDHLALVCDFTSENSTAIDEAIPVGISIYPNPSNDQIYLESDQVIFSIKLIDNMGNWVKEYPSIGFKEFSIDVSDLNSGVYTLIIETGNSKFSRRIIRK